MAEFHAGRKRLLSLHWWILRDGQHFCGRQIISSEAETSSDTGSYLSFTICKRRNSKQFVYLYFVWIIITGWCNRLDGILCPLHVRNSTSIVLGTRCRPQILQSLWRIPEEIHINIWGHEQKHWQRRYELVIHIIFEHFQVNVAIYEHCVKE